MRSAELVDHRIPRGQRGRHFVKREVERDVKGRDGADHSDGLADGDRHAEALTGSRELHRDHFAVELTGFVRRRNQRLAAALGFDARFLDRLAGFHADEPGKLIVVTQQVLTDFEQQVSAFEVGHGCHGVSSLPGGSDGPIEFRRSRAGNFPDRGAVVGQANGVVLRGVDKFAADVSWEAISYCHSMEMVLMMSFSPIAPQWRVSLMEA